MSKKTGFTEFKELKISNHEIEITVSYRKVVV